MNESDQHSFYYPELDGLRFVAFLLVFFHNAPAVLPIFPFTVIHDFGWIGVDMFLSLSALLLTRLLLNEHQRNGKFKIRNFYARRALRIWPLYFLAVFLAALATTELHSWTSVSVYRLVGLMTFTDNWMAAFFVGFNGFAFAPHLWTISYEEQFYAILPWVLRWFLKFQDKFKWLLVVPIVAIGIAIRAWLISLNAPYPIIYVLPLTHFIAIIGGFIAGLGLLDKPLQKVPSWLLLLIGFSYLGVIVSLPNQYTTGWHLMFTYPGISTTLIVHVFTRSEKCTYGALLRNNFMVYLGKISFGLYIYHFFGLNFGLFLVEIWGIASKSILFPIIVLTAGFIVTLSYAEITYRFFEKPFLRQKEKFTMVPSRPV